jgi:site-specific recombinase XerD
MPRKQKFEGEVGVFLKPGSDVWCIRVTSADSKRTVREVGSHKDAVDAYLDHQAAKRLGMPSHIDLMRGPKFNQLVGVAASFYKGQSEAKEKRFLGMADPMLLAFGNRVAATLTTMELETWLLDQADENEWAPPTQNGYKSALVVIFREGVKANLIKKNPAKLILRAKDANRRMRFITEEEERRIRRTILESAKTYRADWEQRLAQIDLAINTGMRKSEQFGLTWDRVHLDQGIVFLENTKNGHSRNVFLNKRSKAALLLMKERHDRKGAAKNALVFPGGSSTRWFDSVLQIAGIHDAVWYTLRHTTASRLVMRGVHIAFVQRIMGHRTLHMTFRYAHLAAGHLLKAVEKLVPMRRPFFGE